MHRENVVLELIVFHSRDCQSHISPIVAEGEGCLPGGGERFEDVVAEDPIAREVTDVWAAFAEGRTGGGGNDAEGGRVVF